MRMRTRKQTKRKNEAYWSGSDKESAKVKLPAKEQAHHIKTKKPSK